MYDLSDCSILVPVQIDCQERLEHIHFLQLYFQTYFLNHQLLILEHGPRQIIPGSHFIPTFETFSTGVASNIGASLIKRPYFCKFDADALIHPKALFDAFELLKADLTASILLPYNALSLNIENPLRAQILHSFQPTSLPFLLPDQKPSLPCLQIKNTQSTGLIHIFRTSTFKDLGGYNEEFRGWGGEDDEILFRFAQLGQSRRFLPNYNAFHFDHPRKPCDPFQIFRNYYRVNLVRQMTPPDLLAYISSWSRFQSSAPT